jgi:hypothetical protein
MILRLIAKTAALVGETAAEWQLRAGRWTTGPRTDAARLQALAAELGVPLREEGVVARRRKRPRPPHTFDASLDVV